MEVCAREVMKVRTRCPACLGVGLSVVYEEPYTGPGVSGYLARQYHGRASHAVDDCTYTLCSCDACGLVFQKYVPSDPLLAELYNAWIPGTEQERTSHNQQLEQYRYLSEQVQFLIQHSGVAPGELDVLDFGFGWGEWSRMAMGFGCNVWGVELSTDRANYGRSIGVRVVELDALPPRKFYFINTEQVFEHLTEPRAVLERLVESLAPAGLIKISVPNAKDALRKLARGDFGGLSAQDQMPIAPLEHINAFDPDSLVAFGRTVGLKPMRPDLFRLYNSASGLLEIRRLMRTLARPVYRHIYPRSTFVYFARG
ncbi:MAG: Methyltransferase type 12 [Ramlibacter sp.]|nr:Methyltransferase type 12 [Ramlibacter sp.]